MIENENEKKQIAKAFNVFLIINGKSLRKFCAENGLKYMNVWQHFNLNKKMNLEKVQGWISLVDSEMKLTKSENKYFIK